MNSIDVIVPCYRYGRFLRECVTSVLSQSVAGVRVLIIDDASPDNTADVARELASEDARVRVIRHVANKGHIATYNEGLDWASARYLLLLSADDYLLPGALERAITFMNAHPSVGLAFGKCMEQYAGGLLLSPSTPAHERRSGTHSMSGAEFIGISGPRNIVPTPTAVVRTSLQKQVGGYLADLPHTGDMEMWLRLAAFADVAVIDAFQAVYRRHEANMSLTYANTGTCVPDFVHRQAALEVFFGSHGKRLANADRLHERLLHSLGREAVSRASSAFNEGNMSGCAELLQLATSLSPRVSRSLPWLKLRLKKFAGRKTWLKIQSMRESCAGDAMKAPPERPAPEGRQVP